MTAVESGLPRLLNHWSRSGRSLRQSDCWLPQTTMNPPLVFGCILLTILATAQLTYQKSVLSTSNEDVPLRRRQPRATKDAPIVFPKNYNLGPPSPCPKGQTFCDGANDYPADRINDLLTNQRPSNLLLGHFYIEENEDEVNKFDSQSGNPLCVSNTQVVFPQKARSRDGTFEFVVNNDQHRQGIRVESCISSANGGGCRIPGSLSYGYTSHCVQKYVHRTLVVLNSNSSRGEGFVTKPFEFPSCCSCEIVGEPNRFGAPDRSKVSGGDKGKFG